MLTLSFSCLLSSFELHFVLHVGDFKARDTNDNDNDNDKSNSNGSADDTNTKCIALENTFGQKCMRVLHTVNQR